MEEETLDLPSCYFSKKNGFSIDFGASLLKVVYLTDCGDTSRLHFVSYEHKDLQVALSLIKEKVCCHLEAGSSVYVTGVVVHKQRQHLEAALGIKLQLLTESDCAVDGFKFLVDNLSITDVTFSNSETSQEYGRTVGHQYGLFVSAWQATGRLWPWKPCAKSIQVNGELGKEAKAEGEEVKGQGQERNYQVQDDSPEEREGTLYPVAFVLAGSTSITFIVHKDGTYQNADVFANAGKTYYGLGCLLTGAKSFHELEELASKGSAANVDITMGGLVGRQADDEYGSCANVDMTIYSFGQSSCKTIGDFSRADLAAATVALVAQSIILPCFWCCMKYGIKKVFFWGSLASGSSSFREQASKLLEFRANLNPEGYNLQHYFLRHGGYVGALGALLRNVC